MTDRVFPASKPATATNGAPPGGAIPPPPAPAAVTSNGTTNGMANQKPQVYIPNNRPVYRPQPYSRRHHHQSRPSCRRICCCCCFWSILIILVLALMAAIAATAMYVIYHPRPPSFSVPSLRISRVNLTTASDSSVSHLSSFFNFTLLSENPNQHLTFSYDPFTVTVESAKSEPSVLRPQSMDEMEQQIMFEMSENLQEQKQSTEAIKFQIGKLLQSQAKMIESLKNMEKMMPMLFSQIPIPSRPPSQPPDPPAFKKSDLKYDCTFLHEVESIETSSLIQQIEPIDVKDVISTNLILSNGSNPEEESRPEEASTHKADLDFGEETMISNVVPSQVSLYHLPVFDGTLPDCWIMEVDRFFELEQYENEEKLNLISLSVEGAALNWFRKHRREFTDWTDIKRKLMARFGLAKGCSPPEVLPKEKFITKVDQDTDFGSEKESTNSVEITSIKGHEVQGTTASHVRQFDVTTIADAVGIAKCCESSLLQHSSATQSRASFSPYQSYNVQPYYERKFGECPEIEFDRESDEIKDVKLQDKQPEEDVKTLVISENEQSLECVGDDPFDDEKPGEVIVEEIVDEPVESSAVRGVKSTINDVKFHLKHKWRSRVLPRLSGLEFCLLPAKLDLRDWPKEESKQHKKKSHQIETFEVLSSLEPSRRYHKESLVVVNDLSSGLGCVIGKTIACVCDPEIGQDNSLDKEEFVGLVGTEEKLSDRLSLANYVWKPGGMSIELDKWKWSDKCYELSRVMKLMQGLSSTRWSYGKVAELTQELQQPKTYLKEIKLKELDKLVACSSVGTEMWLVKCSCEYKIQKLLLFYHSLKVQEKQLFPEDSVELTEVSIISMRKGLVCDKEKKKLINVEDGIKKDKKLDHNLIGLHLQICCCIRGLYRQRGTVYDAENTRLLDTKDGSSEVVAIWEVNHFHVTDFSTTGQKLLLVKEIDKMWYKEDSWLFMQIILKGLCASGVEMETWRVKKSLEWLNKLTTATNLAQMFMDHVCKPQGTPQDMLSDRDPTFLIELFRVLRADLSPDTTYEFIFVQPRPAHFPSRLEETSFAVDMDRNFQKEEELIAMSKVHHFQGQNKSVMEALVQWKEHPPD